MSQLEYIPMGDYFVPNLKLGKTGEIRCGKYARMRIEYLKEHCPIEWTSLQISGGLEEHLREIDQTASSRLEQLMDELPKQQGVTEQLKRTDPMKWVGLMNNCKAQAEEIILSELIFS